MAQPMTYKNRPVVRDANELYFGEPQNPFIVVLTVLQNVNDVPSRILVQLQSTDPALAFSNEKIVKEAERKNLFDAFEIASLWLEKQLSE
jgi:hypothetical protein